MGSFGTGEKNVRGERLINFAEERTLIIASRPEKRMWTWESLDGTTRNQIDFIMTSDRNMSKDCGVIIKKDIGSDHGMVTARKVINSRLERLRKIERKRSIKINIEILEMHEEQFQLEISNRFNVRDENKPAVETFHKIMEEEAERF
ncbi:endonuclease-reverse transcriptase [Plakobranchus ocellatus]|uniref:Endonuclease-reverse transcriptase n=1 Tax=Plakobranchus ocellatus TaxID=259542 RepID=A0AAV3Z9A7_9GAST|nr:endonuclease-reverse transcriptase [Plakobranchus ocellatus]